MDAHRVKPGGPAVRCSDLGGRGVLLVPVLKPSLCDRVLALDALEERRDLCECGLFGEIRPVRFISEGAVVLDVLACGLDSRDTERGGRAFEEVAEGRELGKIFVLAVEPRMGEMIERGCGERADARVSVNKERGKKGRRGRTRPSPCL